MGMISLRAALDFCAENRLPVTLTLEADRPTEIEVEGKKYTVRKFISLVMAYRRRMKL